MLNKCTKDWKIIQSWQAATVHKYHSAVLGMKVMCHGLVVNAIFD